MKEKFYIGLDIGGTKIAAAAVSAKGKIFSRVKTPTPPGAKPAVIFKLLDSLIAQVLTQGGLSKQQLGGIGIGVPGIVDNSNHILATPNINLARFPLCAKLQKKFRVKVSAGNDVNLGLLGEQWLGAGRSADNIVGIFHGTGVGGAIIIDDKLVTGTQGAAAEVGHMIMAVDGPRCNCGNHGCLEAFAGRWAIERDIRAAIKKGRKTLITELIGKKSGRLGPRGGPIKSKYLKSALAKKDAVTVEIMAKAAKFLGAACINMRHICNPQLIILGGGVMEACGSFMLPIINKTFHSDPFFAKVDKCKIVTSKLGDDAVILGAVALVKK